MYIYIHRFCFMQCNIYIIFIIVCVCMYVCVCNVFRVEAHAQVQAVQP